MCHWCVAVQGVHKVANDIWEVQEQRLERKNLLMGTSCYCCYNTDCILFFLHESMFRTDCIL